jgi:hypothetical protein
LASLILVLLVLSDPLTGRLTESGVGSRGYATPMARTMADVLALLRTIRRIRVLVVDADVADVLTLPKVGGSVNSEIQVIYTLRSEQAV